MHEISICEGIVQVLEEQSRIHKYKTVKTVWLEIGPFACVELDALRFGFDVVTKDTLAEGARLEIIECIGEAWCMDCEIKTPLKERYDACPECAGYQLRITSGEELRIKNLEVN